MKIDIPEYVEKIMDMLEENGYEAYIVGGCVRDMILGKNPKDYDITTNALPDEVETVFKDFKTVSIGKRFGTIAICYNNKQVEVTTFRKEGKYTDGRRPEWVSFSKSIEKDLSRRDFTINAIAYNRKCGIVDPFEGQKDIYRKTIRTVGSPRERFKEDYLRILRGVRFATELKFEIEDETLKAAKLYSNNIGKVSMERIADEFFKIVTSEKPSKGIRLLESLGILDIILPEINLTIGFEQKNPHHEMDVYNHILCVLDNTPPILQVRLAALFHDIGKPHTLTIDEKGIGHFYGHDKIGANMAKKILKRFKAPNSLIEKVYVLVKEHMNHHSNFKEKGLKRLISRVGEEEIFNLLELQKADIKCSRKDSKFEHIIKREQQIRKILNNKETYKISQLKINGHDLINLGFKEGPKIKVILEYLLEQVMEDPKKNDKETLKKIAVKKFSR